MIFPNQFKELTKQRKLKKMKRIVGGGLEEQEAKSQRLEQVLVTDGCLRATLLPFVTATEEITFLLDWT